MPSTENSPDRVVHSHKLAVTFGHLSKLAYVKFEENKALLESELQSLGFSLIGTYSCDNHGTQAYLANNEELAVLVFRGTEQNYLDILTDLKFRLKLSESGGVHRGFFAALNAVADDIAKGIEKVGKLPLYVTGHSLGGALAKTSVLFIKVNWAGCYTYGSPAICDQKLFLSNKIPVYRFINAADVVPRAMSLGGIPALIIWSILLVARKLCRLLHIKETWVTARIKMLEVAAPDLAKYEHFGTPIYFEEAGVVVDGKEAPSLFWTIVFRNWKRSFQDHSIDSYIDKLELQALIEIENEVIGLPKNDDS